MIREIDIDEISDGKRYTSEDMVRIGCNDCKDCHNCCNEVGDSIIIDPKDIFNMCKTTKKTFEECLNTHIELKVRDGLVLPNIIINDGGCSFLNEEGRCTIHNYRPGFCRLFPLGRIYENGGFSYFIQVNECPYPNKTKVKVKQWLGETNLKEYERFVLDWHDFIKDMQEFSQNTEDEKLVNVLATLILQTFYMTPYDYEASFYPQFYARLEQLLERLGLNDNE